jgi:phosphate transport system permease protein
MIDLNPPKSRRRRHLKSHLFLGLCITAVLAVLTMIAWILGHFVVQGLQGLSWDLLWHTDSRHALEAGILGGLMGSVFVLAIVLIFSVPLGIGVGAYLFAFAPRHGFWRWNTILIHNLASVPSILFGLIGLAFFLKGLSIPRSSALLAGMTLSILALPVIVITTQSALASVPNNIALGALGLGASPLQSLWHHQLPLAIPQIATGVLLSLARVLGETAPLLLLGQAAFVYDLPHSLLDPITTLPMLIYNWSRYPEDLFAQKAAGAILVLLALVGLLSE